MLGVQCLALSVFFYSCPSLLVLHLLSSNCLLLSTNAERPNPGCADDASIFRIRPDFFFIFQPKDFLLYTKEREGEEEEEQEKKKKKKNKSENEREGSA